jgi:hypothetical protein
MSVKMNMTVMGLQGQSLLPCAHFAGKEAANYAENTLGLDPEYGFDKWYRRT